MNALATLRAELFGALIGLSRATFGNEDLITPSTFAVVVEGLSSGELDADQISDLIRRVNEEKYKLVPSCFYCSSPCGRTSNY
ncbi:MAG: hydroxylamine reductase, partial [Firmicutes bacterium]|nr:hydroxylamine reductase [Bacillota bacterium]